MSVLTLAHKYTRMYLQALLGKNWIQTWRWQTDLCAMYKNPPSPCDSSKLRAVVWNSSKSHFGRGKSGLGGRQWWQEPGSSSCLVTQTRRSGVCREKISRWQHSQDNLVPLYELQDWLKNVKPFSNGNTFLALPCQKHQALCSSHSPNWLPWACCWYKFPSC